MESDSALSLSARILNLRCVSQHGVQLCAELVSKESDSVLVLVGRESDYAQCLPILDFQSIQYISCSNSPRAACPSGESCSHSRSVAASALYCMDKPPLSVCVVCGVCECV